jgi:muconolactone D-isomerase
MLFQVEMAVTLPRDMPVEQAEALKQTEREYAQALQRNGVWRHLWRVVGQYANTSIFDVGGNAELHNILTALPLYPYMTIKVTPLCRHPSSIHEDDR